MKYEWILLSFYHVSSLLQLSQWRADSDWTGSLSLLIGTARSFLRLSPFRLCPADQMTLAAMYLFMLNGYFCDTFLLGLQTKPCARGKRKMHSSWFTLLPSRAGPLTLVKTLLSSLMSLWPIWHCCSIRMIKKTAHLVNTAVLVCATLKHSYMIKRWLIKLKRIYSLFLHGSACR